MRYFCWFQCRCQLSLFLLLFSLQYQTSNSSNPQVAASLDFLTHQGSLVRTFQGSPRTTLQQQQRATTSMVMSGGKEVMINAVTGRPVPPEAPQQVWVCMLRALSALIFTSML